MLSEHFSQRGGLTNLSKSKIVAPLPLCLLWAWGWSAWSFDRLKRHVREVDVPHKTDHVRPKHLVFCVVFNRSKQLSSIWNQEVNNTKHIQEVHTRTCWHKSELDKLCWDPKRTVRLDV